jgi:hypothetical protein
LAARARRAFGVARFETGSEKEPGSVRDSTVAWFLPAVQVTPWTATTSRARAKLPEPVPRWTVQRVELGLGLECEAAASARQQPPSELGDAHVEAHAHVCAADH